MAAQKTDSLYSNTLPFIDFSHFPVYIQFPAVAAAIWNLLPSSIGFADGGNGKCMNFRGRLDDVLILPQQAV